MSAHRYEIGGIVLEADILLPELIPACAARADVFFGLLAAGTPDEEPRSWVRRWSLGENDGDAWALFARQEGGWLIRFPSCGDFRISSDGRRIVCRPLPGIPAATIRHLLLDQAMPLALSQRGACVLHASAVALGQHALGFIGQSGSGKSTLAATLAGYGAELLCDDCLIAKEEGSAWHLLPYYPGVRLWPETARNIGLGRSHATEVAHYTQKLRIGDEATLPFRRLATPLGGLCFLCEEGDEVSIRRLTAREAFLALVEASYLLELDEPSSLKDQFEAVGRIADAVPCHMLCYPYSYEVLPRVRNALLDCLSMDQSTGKPCPTVISG